MAPLAIYFSSLPDLMLFLFAYYIHRLYHIHQSILKDYIALFTTVAGMLNELAALDSDSVLRRRIEYCAKPSLLIIDEIGCLSYSNRHADLLFEIITQRYENKSTFITTNKGFFE